MKEKTRKSESVSYYYNELHVLTRFKKLACLQVLAAVLVVMITAREKSLLFYV